MANQGENKIRNHINTGVLFKFIHYMADLIGWGGAKCSLLHNFFEIFLLKTALLFS